MPSAVAAALGVTGSSYLACGLVLAVVGRARVAGLIGALTGATLLTLVGLEFTGRSGSSMTLLVLAAQLGVLALTVYPHAPWEHWVDRMAVVLVAGAPVSLLAAMAVGESAAVAAMAGEVVTAAVVLVLVLHTWWRLERGTRQDRWPLTWMSLSTGLAMLVGGLVNFAVATTITTVVLCLTFALIGPALYIGVARPEVVDVRGLVVRCVVLLTSLLAYVALFMAVAAILEIAGYTIPSAAGLALVGAVCAIAFHPTQVILRGVVDEMLFGQRPDPLGAASQVAGQIGDDPVLALRTIRDALVLPYASLFVDGMEVASSGTSVTYIRTIPLILDQDTVGELRVGLRAGDLGLTAGDERVLKLITPLLAQTVRARALTAEVQASRQAVITAVAEERRRLRRDLHDSLGARLSGIAFTTDAVRNTMRADIDSADRLLITLRAETGTAIKEIRQLVYRMRPAALDELGLVPAIRQQAAMLRTTDEQPLRVVVRAADLPVLPAAVEVAAYRIVLEALMNVARHSGSDAAEVGLQVQDGALVIEVRDAATGAGRWAAGVGLASMRERTAELGGVFSAGPTSDGGRVQAMLPLPDRLVA